MTAVALVLAGIAALLHVYIWTMESITWKQPATWKRFGLESQADADTTAPLAYNQGYYNLFLAVVTIVGIVLVAVDRDDRGLGPDLRRVRKHGRGCAGAGLVGPRVRPRRRHPGHRPRPRGGLRSPRPRLTEAVRRLARMLRLATVNVNGIRAAHHKSRGQTSGFSEWLASRDCDIVTLQEVRAPDDVVRDIVAESGYHVAHTRVRRQGTGRRGGAEPRRAEGRPPRLRRLLLRRHRPMGRGRRPARGRQPAHGRVHVRALRRRRHAPAGRQVPLPRADAHPHARHPRRAARTASSPATSTSATPSTTSGTGRATSARPASCPRSARTSTAPSTSSAGSTSIAR